MANETQELTLLISTNKATIETSIAKTTRLCGARAETEVARAPPRRTGLEGAYPSLAVLSDGSLAISYGRPGAMLAFSSDKGRTWTDFTIVDSTPYSGYTDVVETEPGHLLVGFGARDYLDPVTGYRSNQLRLSRVRFR